MRLVVELQASELQLKALLAFAINRAVPSARGRKVERLGAP
jgi:hypothetical protein